MEVKGLSKEEYTKPRELAYYGGIRKGFEQAREGLDAVIEHCEELLAKDTNNVRLQRYVGALQKMSEKMHTLQMKASRLKDRSKGAV